ncbi:MAG: hypothetical protein DRJ42_26510 [Deltaproteobacteria bacterium]|nr:MAG: hypothetical protein DRJ42_26510 [Deltaproteobacteria bacterium]
MTRLLCIGLVCSLFACGDDGGTTDAGTADTGTADTGTMDSAATDTGAADTGVTDTGAPDTGSGDAAADSAMDGSTACSSDTDCTAGSEWCVGGECVACDNSGSVCDLACGLGWEFYERNGCTPCACAPTNQCTADSGCLGAGKCYAGEFCWDWCPAGDPSCCFGNFCEAPGCTEPPPSGCITRGCAEGSVCQDFATSGVCVGSVCSCSGGSWLCTEDCNGGSCVTPP